MRSLVLFCSWSAILVWSVPGCSQQPVKLTRSDDRIEVTIGGKLFTTYYFGPQVPKPYLHHGDSDRARVAERYKEYSAKN